MMARAPAVAGTFYEASGSALRRTVESLLANPDGRVPDAAIGLMVPHAGYMFSGAIAGRTWSRVVPPDVAFVLAPNHTGLGHPAAIGTDGPWRLPVGDVAVDVHLAKRLARACPDLALDDLAHASEHAVEVQLPFLFALNPEVRIVPVCLRTMSYAACERIGKALAMVSAEVPGRVLLVASSDMNHYEPRRVAERKDRMALDRMKDLDPQGLYQAVVDHHVSMCGFVPAVAMLIAARERGAKYAEVVAYGTSAEVNGDESSVVGYAGVLVSAQRPRHVTRSLHGGPQPEALLTVNPDVGGPKSAGAPSSLRSDV